jgi:hypothetical protein
MHCVSFEKPIVASLVGNSPCMQTEVSLPCVSCLWAAARKPDTQPSAPHHTDNLKTKAPNTTSTNHLYNTLELLMMGIMVPETC